MNWIYLFCQEICVLSVLSIFLYQLTYMKMLRIVICSQYVIGKVNNETSQFNNRPRDGLAHPMIGKKHLNALLKNSWFDQDSLCQVCNPGPLVLALLELQK